MENFPDSFVIEHTKAAKFGAVKLFGFPEMNRFKFQRLRKIGVSIIDAEVMTVTNSGVLLNDPNIWKIELKDNGEGFPIADSARESDIIKLKSMYSSNVVASSNNPFITWSNYNGLINFNATRKWNVGGSPNS